MTPPARVLVACVGNGLVADDAVGAAVHDGLAECGVPDDVRVLQLETAGFALVDRLEGEATLIVVDAVRLGAAPGTVHVLDWDHVPAAPGPAVSAHGIGVREAIDAGRLLWPDRMPARTWVVGVEGACFDRLGGAMTPAVAAAVPRAVAAVQRLARADADSLPRS